MKKISHTTLATAEQLNYHHYTKNKYDCDITRSIPGHEKIHNSIARYLKNNYNKSVAYSVLDLGVGTGITSRVILDCLPKARFDLVDFSTTMLKQSKIKMGKSAKYHLEDMSLYKIKPGYYDIVTTVIGMHHQSDAGKKKMFKNIYKGLKKNGVFIFGDLMTYSDKNMAALNNALHFHNLVENSTDKKTLTEWAYHHMFLNKLTPMENQVRWLEEVGFRIVKNVCIFNTVLLICEK